MNKYLGNLIISLLIIIFYGLIPIYCTIENIYKIITRKKIEEIAGKLLNKINDKLDYLTFYAFIILIISIFWVVKNKSVFTLLFLLQGLLMLSSALLRKVFSYSNGIYKGGLIINGFIPWDNVHSYKVIDKGTISFLINTGNRVDVNAIREIDEITNELQKNNVKEM